MTKAVQFALPLPPREAFGREDFLVAPSNAEAVAWLDRWPDWPTRTLAIFGPRGSGKTHLAHVWKARSGAILLDAARLRGREPRSLMGEHGCCAIEGADRGVDETAFLHLINAAGEAGGYLLLIGRRPPSRWPIKLADLGSRLKSVPAVGLGPPGDRLLAALLVKQFADRQIRVKEEVVAYLVARMERSADGALRLVEALDSASLAGRRDVTVPLARQVLESLEGEDEGEGRAPGTESCDGRRLPAVPSDSA